MQRDWKLIGARSDSTQASKELTPTRQCLRAFVLPERFSSVSRYVRLKTGVPSRDYETSPRHSCWPSSRKSRKKARQPRTVSTFSASPRRPPHPDHGHQQRQQQQRQQQPGEPTATNTKQTWRLICSKRRAFSVQHMVATLGVGVATICIANPCGFPRKA